MSYQIYQIDTEFMKSDSYIGHPIRNIQFRNGMDQKFIDENFKAEFIRIYKNVVDVDLSSKEYDLWDLYRILNVHEHEVYVAGSGELEDRYEDILSNYETSEKHPDMKLFASLSIGDIVYDEEESKWYILGNDFFDITEKLTEYVDDLVSGKQKLKSLRPLYFSRNSEVI